MGIRVRNAVAVAAIVMLASFGVSGCTITGSGQTNGDGTSGNGTSNNGSGNGNAVIAPVIADLSSIDGQTVTVPINNVVDLNSGTTKVTVWSGTVADPTIATFIAGKDDGSAQFDPGIKPLKAGDTSVTVMNSDTGESSTFDLVVEK